MLRMWDVYEERLQVPSGASPREKEHAQQGVGLEEWVYLSLLEFRGCHLKFQVPDMELQVHFLLSSALAWVRSFPCYFSDPFGMGMFIHAIHIGNV